MYERSAIVLERYLDKLFGFNKEINLKENYENYKSIVKETKNYQTILEEEEDIIRKFDEVAECIQELQRKQNKISAANKKIEEYRIELFNELGDNPLVIEERLKKIEVSLDNNNEAAKQLSKEFVNNINIFIERQKERNKCARKKRVAESNYINYIENANKAFTQISEEEIKNIKSFLSEDKQNIIDEICKIMIKNGKNEKIGFNKEVINKAVETRIKIAEKEIECYLTAYEKNQKLLSEINNGELRLAKHEKTLRDVSVKIAFLEAEKEYVFGFLDNERLTVMSGLTRHTEMMEEACRGFENDILQINNLYELVLKEITNKSTKKAYKDLYNKTYLKVIEQKEKNYEDEINQIRIQTATIINSNYWRIEGIKNVYEVFQKEITEKFNRDLSEFQLEEIEESNEVVIKEEEQELVIEENKTEVMEPISLNFNIIHDDEEIENNEFIDSEEEDTDDEVEIIEKEEEDDDNRFFAYEFGDNEKVDVVISNDSVFEDEEEEESFVEEKIVEENVPSKKGKRAKDTNKNNKIETEEKIKGRHKKEELKGKHARTEKSGVKPKRVKISKEQQEDKIDRIMQNTRKKQIQELSYNDNNKSILNKLFKK